MENQQNRTEVLKPKYILEVILRRQWFLIIPLCLSVIAGIFLSVSLPKIYSANTLILVTPQRVPTSYVRSVVSTGIASRISTISQQIMSRTNLEKIIDLFKLYSEPKHIKMFMEDKVENIRRRIAINVTRVRRGAEAFSINFKGQNREKVVQVANALATYFIDENLKAREAHAIGTSDFLEDELDAMRNRLEGLETRLKNYRGKHMGALPEQLETNLRILDRLQIQLSERQQSLKEAKNALATMETQMSQAPLIYTDPALVDLSGPETFESEASQQLVKMKTDLEVLRTKYTDRHPDVVRLKKMIDRWEEKIEQEEDTLSEAPVSDAEADEATLPAFNYLALQESQLLVSKREIGILEEKMAKLNRTIQIYEKRVEETPKREQELMSLKRDYDNINNTYNSLLNRKLEAEIAVNMEKKQKGEQFRILDPAKLPEKPISPNMNRLFLLTLAAGLAVGGGLIFLLEYFDTSFRMPKEIESILGLSVIATFPIVCQPRDIWTNRFKQALSLTGVATCAGLLAIFYVLTQKGVEETLAFVRRVIAILPT